MKYERGYRSDDVEDRRGRGGTIAKVGGGLSVPVILLVVLLNVCAGGEGGDLGSILGELGGAATQGQAAPGDTGGAIAPEDDPESETVSFVHFVFDDVQATWDEIFTESGLDYRESTLVLYRGGTETAGCGYGQSAYGPFYCPADSRTYLDLAFFDTMQSRLGAGGDFAHAYVIAHEVGHHVQNQLGISTQVRQRQQADPDGANELSVRMELQADCFAGVWAYAAYEAGLTESGDLQEAIDAAEAIGDDALTQGQAHPDDFTHGTSRQRMDWFGRGYETGDPNQCNTFA